MTITSEALADILWRISPPPIGHDDEYRHQRWERFEDLAPIIIRVCREKDISSEKRVALFISLLLTESCDLSQDLFIYWETESLLPEEEKAFYRRGALPVMGRDAYEKIGRLLSQNFISTPDLLSDLPWGILAAGEIWADQEMNYLADHSDLPEAMRRINFLARRPELEKIDRLTNYYCQALPRVCAEFDRKPSPEPEKVSSVWAITAKTLDKISHYHSHDSVRLEEISLRLNNLLKNSEVGKSRLRVAHFLAQCFEESFDLDRKFLDRTKFFESFLEFWMAEGLNTSADEKDLLGITERVNSHFGQFDRLYAYWDRAQYLRRALKSL